MVMTPRIAHFLPPQTNAALIFAALEAAKKAQREKPKLDPNQLPDTIEKRVFVGGSYRIAPVLRVICEYVRANGFTPIFLGEFAIPESKTYEYSMRLLSQCSRAIFDITIDNGHLMEIQELKNKTWIKPLLVYMAFDVRKDISVHVTSVLRDMDISTSYQLKQGYISFDELSHIVREFLLNVH